MSRFKDLRCNRTNEEEVVFTLHIAVRPLLEGFPFIPRSSLVIQRHFHDFTLPFLRVPRGGGPVVIFTKFVMTLCSSLALALAPSA